MRKLLSALVLLLCLASWVKAQEIGVKTNLLYGGVAQAPNLGLEVKLGNRWSVDVSGGYNWYNRKGTPNNNKKLIHWLALPELRYWLCEGFTSHYFGVHLLGTQYNISQYNMPLLFGANSHKYRYEGWAAGAGVSYGYQLPIAKHWNVEFSLGVGYAYMNYDKYLCDKCGRKVQGGVKNHYFGPTKAAISLIYIIK